MNCDTTILLLTTEGFNDGEVLVILALLWNTKLLLHVKPGRQVPPVHPSVLWCCWLGDSKGLRVSAYESSAREMGQFTKTEHVKVCGRVPDIFAKNIHSLNCILTTS